MNELEQLLNSNRPWAAQRAANALHINASFRSGQLSQSEAVELLQDLINTDALDKEADDFTTRTEIVNAITDLINVLSAVTSIPGV